jgi:hypothetical protein
MTIEEKKKLWENNLSKIYSDIDNKEIGSLLKIVIYENFGAKIYNLYNIIDDDVKFTKIMDEFSKKNVEFPDVDDFTSAIILAMVYYYKEVLGYDWMKIQELLPYERDVCLRYGTKIRSLKSSIKRKLNKSQPIEDKETIF